MEMWNSTSLQTCHETSSSTFAYGSDKILFILIELSSSVVDVHKRVDRNG